MSNRKLASPILTAEMAAELEFELWGLSCSADDPDQYTEKMAALEAIADGRHRVVKARRRTVKEQP